MTQFIKGQWLAGEGHDVQSTNPANGEVIWLGKTATAAQVNSAVEAARAAQFDWFMLGYEGRLSIVEAYRDQLEAHKAEIAETIAQETGKPQWETMFRIPWHLKGNCSEVWQNVLLLFRL